ncbi:MAG: hypothetical protein KAY24_12280, partial [Candidatus Eisenbacteria sp.]|nr:hypothetical protein [Candidatus Eisenbacteria bacterium]
STRTAAPEGLPAQMAENLRATGLGESAGREVKIVVDRRFSASEMKAVLDWLEELAAKIEEHGLAE